MAHPAENDPRFVESLQDYLTLQQVAKAFGLRMRGYHKQGNCAIIETDEGPKGVRRLRHSPEEYKFACRAADFLRGQGFSRLPRITWAPSGDPLAQVQGTNYTMHDWVSGRQVVLENVCQLTQAVEMLAWFHRCGQGFRADTTGVRDDWGSWPRRFGARIEEFYRFEEKARAGEDEDHESRHFLRNFDEFLKDAAKALEALEASPYKAVIEAERERGGLCHRDYVGKNLVLRDDGALYLGDFDDLAMDSRLEDLGKFLLRHGHWDLERVLFILQIYHGVYPLAREDIVCLGAYLRFPTEFWSAAADHYAGKHTEKHVFKKLAAQLQLNRGFIEGLAKADLSFLTGTYPLYNLGFANLPEVPTGKDWLTSAWPSAPPAMAAESDWSWQPAIEVAEGMVHEPAFDFEAMGLGMVLDEIGGVGIGDVWPHQAQDLEGSTPAAFAFGLEAEEEIGTPMEITAMEDLGSGAETAGDPETAGEPVPETVKETETLEGIEITAETGPELEEAVDARQGESQVQTVKEESIPILPPEEESAPPPKPPASAVVAWRPFPAPLRGKAGDKHRG